MADVDQDLSPGYSFVIERDSSLQKSWLHFCILRSSILHYCWVNLIMFLFNFWNGQSLESLSRCVTSMMLQGWDARTPDVYKTMKTIANVAIPNLMWQVNGSPLELLSIPNFHSPQPSQYVLICSQSFLTSSETLLVCLPNREVSRLALHGLVSQALPETSRD